jgi:hypothetical protein
MTGLPMSRNSKHSASVLDAVPSLARQVTHGTAPCIAPALWKSNCSISSLVAGRERRLIRLRFAVLTQLFAWLRPTYQYCKRVSSTRSLMIEQDREAVRPLL